MVNIKVYLCVKFVRVIVDLLLSAAFVIQVVSLLTDGRVRDPGCQFTYLWPSS